MNQKTKTKLYIFTGKCVFTERSAWGQSNTSARNFSLEVYNGLD